MAAKGTRVTQQEKEKMWQLYQQGYTLIYLRKDRQATPAQPGHRFPLCTCV